MHYKVKSAITDKTISKSFALVLGVALITSCGKSPEETLKVGESEQANPPSKIVLLESVADVGAGITEFVPLADSAEIPYPIYPNATRYRIGGENGLKIVVFETKDGFADVDRYFSDQFETSKTQRQLVMSDFVRYSPQAIASTTDNKPVDPWSTSEPGIVIHQFTDASDALSYGAEAESRTNIIMSYH